MCSNNYHGVIHGDSEILMDELIDQNIKHDLILTDPPYNINKDFGNKSDCLNIPDLIDVTRGRIKKLRNLLTPNGSIIWFGIHRSLPRKPSSLGVGRNRRVRLYFEGDFSKSS